MRRRLGKLETMLASYPKVDAKQRAFIKDLCLQDPSTLEQPRLLFNLLVELDKIEPRMIQRIVDIVFSEQEPEFSEDMYAPPYGPAGYGGRPPNPYTRDQYGRQPYGAPPAQGDRYAYERPAPSPRGAAGMISMAEHERMIDIERRAAFLEADNRRMRTESRQIPPQVVQPPPSREAPVKIKRPVLGPDGSTVIDYQTEEIPVDVYKQQLVEERYEKMFAMANARNQAPPPEHNAEAAALREEVAQLRSMMAAKEKDKQLEGLKNDIGAQLQTATKGMVELQKRTDARLEEIEKNKGGGGQPGEMGDDARIIVAEIHEGSALTRAALEKTSGLLEKYMDLQVKVNTPNKQRKPQDRTRYKEELDSDEVRILHEELPDGEVEDEES